MSFSTTSSFHIVTINCIYCESNFYSKIRNFSFQHNFIPLIAFHHGNFCFYIENEFTSWYSKPHEHKFMNKLRRELFAKGRWGFYEKIIRIYDHEILIERHSSAMKSLKITLFCGKIALRFVIKILFYEFSGASVNFFKLSIKRWEAYD